MEECRAETVALFCKSIYRTTMAFIIELLQVASNLEILELFNVRDYSKVEIGPHADILLYLVYNQTRPRGYSIHHVPPHGSCWITGARVLRSCQQKARTSPHASPVGCSRHSFDYQLILLCRLGITQTLIQGGIARLEELRDKNGKLENLYIRASFYRVGCGFTSRLTIHLVGRS